MENDPTTRGAENPNSEERPFDPNSQRLITIQDKDGTEREITIAQWLQDLGTNGRGGT